MAIASLLAAVAISCSEDPLGMTYNTDSESSHSSYVVLPVESSDATRTAISDDGLTTTWVVGDQVALWADVESSGEAYLVGETFQLKYYSSTYTNAEFAGTISKEMIAQEYNYRGFYPIPSSIEGKIATFEIPTTQSGKYDGSLDFRVADPEVGRELTTSTMDGCDALSFRSIMHAFRITIPADCSAIDVPVKRLIVTLPVEIAGEAQFDMSQVESIDYATLSGDDASATVTIDLGDESLNAGDGNYVWMFFNPIEGVTGDIIISAVGTNDRETIGYTIPIENHSFLAGRITPINTEIMDELPVTTIRFATTYEKLGEPIEYVTITAPEDAIFQESGTNEAIIYNDGTNNFSVSYLNDNHELFVDKSLTVQFDSEHATIPAAEYSLSDISLDQINTFSVDMPYLLYEDFSTIATFEYNSNESTTARNTSTGDDTAIDLCTGTYDGTNYCGLKTAGWIGVRVGGSSTGGSIRVTGREAEGTKYPASLTSPAFALLKESASVTIELSYDYDGNEAESGSTYTFLFWSYDPAYGYPVYSLYKSSTAISGYSNVNYGSTSTAETDSFTFTGSYTAQNKSVEKLEIEGVTSTTTLKWVSTCVKDTGDSKAYQNGNYYLYLDNIRASIKSTVAE